jgi:hypothetical protein
VPLALAATAQSTVVAFWYYRYIDLGNWWLNVIIAVVAGLALDAIVVTTIMGRRMGRDSKWSMAASFGAFICSALIAVDSYSAWLAPIRPLLHVSYPLMVFLYSQHLASNMHAPARARSVPLAAEAPVVQTKTIEAIPARAYTCPNCDAALTLGAYGAAVRNRYCAGCKNSVVMTSNGKEH